MGGSSAIRAMLLPACLTVAAAHGGVAEFEDKGEWIAAVGPFTTIDFTGFPDGTFITDQYADLGVIFTDGDDTIQMSPSHVNDGWGLRGNGIITLAFDTPQAWIGVDFPGFLRITLFSAGKPIHTGGFGFGGTGNFGGLLSSELFDEALLTDPGDSFAYIDDLHFGVPAPPTLGLLGLAVLLAKRRRDLS